jgi:hypothetical protein
MGRRAAETVARACANETVLASHLACRAEVVAGGASRSLRPPAGERRELLRLARGRLADREELLVSFPRFVRKALRSPRQATADALKALGRLARREAL